VHDGIITFEPLARSLAFDDPSVVSGQCRWIGGTAFACRRSLLTEFPLDPGMSTYFEDNEWCYRIEQQYPGSFRTASEAFVLHHQESKERKGSAPNELLRAAGFIVPMAHFYARHGLIQEDLFGFVSELTMRRNARCRRRAPAARAGDGKRERLDRVALDDRRAVAAVPPASIHRGHFVPMVSPGKLLLVGATGDPEGSRA